MKKQLLLLALLATTTSVSLFAQQHERGMRIAGKYLNEFWSISSVAKTATPACDTLYSFDARPMPSGLAFDGTHLWMLDTIQVYKVSTAGVYLDSFPNPATAVFFFRGGEMTYDGSHLWVVDEQTAQLFKVNPSSGATVAQYDLPSYGETDPNGIGLAWDGTYLWHSQYDPAMIYKIDPTSGMAVDSFATGREFVAIEWVGSELFACTYNSLGDSLFRIDPLTGEVLDSTEWCVPYALGIAWDGSTLWQVSGEPFIFGIPTNGLRRVFGVSSTFVAADEMEDESNRINVYPNPVDQMIFVKGTAIRAIELIQPTGQVVLRHTLVQPGQATELDVSQLSSGIYFLRVTTADGVQHQKVLLK
jgi:glutamine cyclotransferase